MPLCSRQQGSVPSLEVEQVLLCGLVLDHELQRLAIEAGSQLKPSDHVELVAAHVYHMLQHTTFDARLPGLCSLQVVCMVPSLQISV